MKSSKLFALPSQPRPSLQVTTSRAHGMEQDQHKVEQDQHKVEQR